MTVYLVGAGPGDPGLITARGLELVRSCDALVYDRLVSDDLVAEAPPDALRVCRERLGQRQIEHLLVRLASTRLDVVRLKGGDPFVFGRGGEEALALERAGVDYEVVPGVSAASAVPAAAGIPITHRGTAAQATIVSGHDPARLDYDSLARAPGTLVIFMGLSSLDAIARGLVAAGKPPDTPTAVVENGTLPEQRVVRAPLAEVAAEARSLGSPALVVIGHVVDLTTASRSGRRRSTPVPARAT